MLPEVTQEMLSDLNNDDISLDAIVEKVNRSALAAKSLTPRQCFHLWCQLQGGDDSASSRNAPASKISKNLIRISIFTKHLPRAACRGFDNQAFWRHNIATAICAN